MANNIRLQGRDLGIIAGGAYDLAPGGVFLYRPKNDLIPNPEMSRAEIIACLDGTKHFKIPYQVVKQVEVNADTVWRNRDCFDLISMGIDPFSQVYWGRGNISVEFRNDVPEIEELIETILKTGIGLERKQ